MSCDACQRAEVNPRTGRYNAFCDQCAARALALSPDFHEAAGEGRWTPRYRTALSAYFPEREEQGHAMVKEWAERVKQRKVSHG